MSRSSPHRVSERRRRSADVTTVRNVIIACFVVTLAAFLTFSATIGYEFLRYDDEIAISTNSHLRPFSVDTILWLFTHSYFQSYAPVTLLSHAVDVAVWGEDARGHHLTNVILHSLNSGLLLVLAFLVLSRVTRRPGGEADVKAGMVGAVATALIFAMHPLCVEPVAWVSGRKDLLMGFFLFSSVLAYVIYALRRDAGSGRRVFRLSLMLFVLAVLSRTTAAAASPLLLGLDLLLSGSSKADMKRLTMEKLPFLLVSLGGGIAALLAARGAHQHAAITQLDVLQQFLLPLYSVAFFAGKLVWPSVLSPVYVTPPGGMILAYSAVTLVITGTTMVLFRRRRSAGFLAGWGAYVVLLSPALTGAYAGIQPWADRYSYVPMVALLMLVGGGVAWLWSRPAARRAKKWVVAGLAMVACTCLLRTIQQLPYWKDSVSLWKHATMNAPEAGPQTLVPLGVAYYQAGFPDSAITMYRRAVSLQPEDPQAYFSMGEAYAAKGELGSAAENYLEALRRDSVHFGARTNLADIYLQVGNVDQALAMYRALRNEEPENPLVHSNLGFALMRTGDADGAEASFRMAIRLAPGMKSPLVNLGVLYQNTGRPDQAAEILESALRLDPDDSGVNYNLAIALESLKRPAEAEEAYRRALIARPKFVDAWINLGNLIGRLGRLQEARAMYRQVAASIPQSAELCLNLAGIYNALGERDSALASLQEAIRRKPDFAQAYYAMGLFYRKAGDSVSARQSFQIAARYGSKEAAAMLQPGSAAKPPPVR
jgi:protein O-mannosyl-transferase